MDACVAAGVTKLVFTSTCTVVFDGGAMTNVDERLPVTDAVDPPYVATKVSGGNHSRAQVYSLTLV